jgi:hypothetical protein
VTLEEISKIERETAKNYGRKIPMEALQGGELLEISN